MIDFKLNKTDDVFFEHKKRQHPFSLRFAVSKQPVFRLSFSTDAEYKNDISSFRISFYTNEPYDDAVSIGTITGNPELAQNIKIALQTELGELPDMTFGSELYLYKHKDITNNENLAAIEEIASDIASGIVGEDVTASAVAERNDDAGYFYGQSVTIYLYTNGDELCRFTL